MELTRNFTLSELTKSDTAIRKGINNNPNAEQIEKLKRKIFSYVTLVVSINMVQQMLQEQFVFQNHQKE